MYRDQTKNIAEEWAVRNESLQGERKVTLIKHRITDHIKWIQMRCGSVYVFTLFVRRVVGLVGGILRLWFGPSNTLEGRVIENQCKVILTDRLYLMMNHFYPDGGELSSRMTPVHKNSLNGLERMKMR